MILRPTFLFSAGGLPTTAATNLELTVDGTLISIPDTFAAAYPLAPVVTTNGYTVIVDQDINGNAGNLKISIDTLKVWESITVRIRSVKATYETYDQTFVVYGYDLGNTFGGGGIVGNYSFVIFQIATAQVGILPSVGSIVYRKPFTRRVYYYRSTADGNTCRLYDATSGTDIALGTSGFITNNEEDVLVKAVNNSGGVTTITSTVPLAVWTPPFTLSVDTDCPDDDCITPLSTNTASLQIDYTTLKVLRLNDVDVYPYNNQGIVYKLYKHDGTLVSSKVFGYTISPPFVFPLLTYDWVGFTIPEAGSYVIQGCIEMWEDITDNAINSGDLVEGQWYVITDNSGGADWTNLGAPNNNVDTEFMATSSGAPTDWGTGILKSISKIYECCKNEKLHGCTFAKLTQEDCNQYKVKNLSFDNITVVVSKMVDLTTFEVVNTYPLAMGESVTITPVEDNVYTVQVTNETTAESFIQVIVADCVMKTCLLAYIKDLICQCKKGDECTNFCEEFYDFIAFITLGHTYFNMLNTLYSIDYMFTTLQPSKIAELYSIKQVLDRMKEYCTCNSCNKSIAVCGCKH